MTGPPPPDLAALDLDASYSPANIDRFARRVERLAMPPWGFFVLVFLAAYLLCAAGRWLSGQRNPLLLLAPAPLVIWDVGILALHQYLDRYAITALRTFNRTLNADEAQLRRLEQRLTVAPLRLEAASALLWVVIAGLLVRLQLGTFLAYIPGWELILSVISFSIGGAFLAHVIYQLRLVSQIHAAASEINLFDPEPLYSFSGLTARTALGIVLIQYLVLLALPGEVRMSTVLVPTFVLVVVAAALFVWPLWGMHRRLAARKASIAGDISSLLKQSVEQATAGAASGVIEDPEKLDKTFSVLRAAQATVVELSTWPWQPSTVRGFVTALLLPIVVYLLQEIAARLAGL